MMITWKFIRRTLRDYWIVLLAPVFLLAPLIIRGQVLYWGTPSLQFIPWWSYALDSLRQGVLPLWNPLNGFGAPLIANYQSAFFYPPNWLLLLFGALGGSAYQAAAIAWGFMLLTTLHLAWAGLGMSVFLRRLEFGWLGQVVGGLSFGLSGYIVVRLGFFSMAWVFAWLPWVMITANEMVSTDSETLSGIVARFRKLPPLVICLAMQLLAGHAQLSWYSVLLTTLWVVVISFRRGGLRKLVSSAISLGIAGLLAAGLAAVQLVPTFEYLQQSQRADAFAYEEALTYSFWPWRFLTIFSPDFFGSPAAGNFWGYASYWEDHIYAGLLPALLALATGWLLLKGIRRSKRCRWWWIVVLGWLVMVATFLLAMGRFTPVFPFLYKYVPTFDMFQAPARYLIWVSFFIPILAAVGIEHWRCPQGKGLYWFRLGTAGAFAITLGAGLAWIYMQNIQLTFIRAAAWTGFWALGFGLLTLVIPFAAKKNKKKVWRWGVILWVLLDLLVTGWTQNPGIDWRFYQTSSPIFQNEAQAYDLRVYLTRRDEYDLKFGRFMRFFDFRALEDLHEIQDVMLPNLNLLNGIPSANNFDPLVPDRYARFMALIETINPNTQQEWLRQAGVGWVEHIDVRQNAGVQFTTVESASRWAWYSCAQAVENREQASKILESRITAGEQAPGPILVEMDSSLDSGQCVDVTGQINAITSIAEKPDRLVLKVESPRAGWLFVANTWYPGWRATIDQMPVDIYPANVMFQAVQIPAGVHEVMILYRPFGFYFGALFSILVLLLMTISLRIMGRSF